MATRAAIAAADRKVKTDIDAKQRNWDKKKWKQEYRLRDKKNTIDSISAAGTAMKGASSLMGSIAAMNDPEWYKRYGYDPYAAAIPDFYRLGADLFSYWRSRDSLQPALSNAPGVMVFEFQDTVPNPNETNVPTATYYQESPLNVSLTRFMANLRKLNSRIGDYDPADLGMYWYAIRSHVTFLAMVVKGITVYNTYFARNAYFARILLHAIGFDPADFIDNIAEIRLLAKRYIDIFNVNAVIPNNLSFVLRGIWLGSALVKDHESENAQIYTFRPYSLGYFAKDENEVNYSKVTYPMSFNSISNTLANQSSNLFNSVGIVTMLADLRAAYGDNVMQFNPDLNAQAQFSVSKHDLEQIHNLKTLPCFLDSAGVLREPNLTRLWISQDNDGFLFQGSLSGGVADKPLGITYTGITLTPCSYDVSIQAGQNQSYLNFYDEESVNPDMFLEATRLRTVVFGGFPTGENYVMIKYCGTEVVVRGVVYTLDPNNLPNPVQSPYYTDVVYEGSNAAHKVILSTMLHQGQSFDWAPVLRGVEIDATSDVFGYYYDYGEIDHAVLLSHENLKWLHSVATLSEFFTDPVAPGRK